MKWLLTTAIIGGLTLGVQGAYAQDAPGPILRVLPNRNAKVEAQAHGDNVQRVVKDLLTVSGANGLRPNIIEFAPDGRGNIIFASSASVRTEKGAFLGIYATRAPAVLKEQMKLKAGLVVDRVQPKSPADLAGLKPLDVVEKLDDQWLINPDQLLGLLRMRSPGDTVSLTIFHKGDRQTLKVKLDEHDVPVVDDEPQFDLPNGLTIDRPAAKTWVERATNGPGTMLRTIKILEGNTSGSADGDAVYEDKGINLRLTFKDGHRSLTATDTSGKTIFKGPIDTQQDREKLPKEVRQKMERLEKLRADVEAKESLRAEPPSSQQDQK